MFLTVEVPMQLKYPKGAGRRCPEFLAGFRLADSPCPHPPGSPGRIRTLQRRVEQRLRTDHPGDRREQASREAAVEALVGVLDDDDGIE